MRIITGTAKGCKLKTPAGVNTRPTSDRVKESLFSILGNDVLGQRVLDIFAGTGSLGLEALSRGANKGVFVDKATAEILQYNIEHTRLQDKAQILKGDVFAQLGSLAARGQKFDIVFCDPPYHQGLSQKALSTLDESPILEKDALVIIEHGGDENDLPVTKNLKLIKNQKYGKITQISFYHWPVAPEEVEPS